MAAKSEAAAGDVASSAERRRALWICAGLVALTLATYASVAHHEFVDWDDPRYVTENPHVASGLSWDGIAWAFTTTWAGNWHPLTWLSHMLDVTLFGLAPGPHHLVNVAFHAANAVLLFLVLRAATGAAGRSAFVAALFAVHPLHVESVAWVAERKDVLATLFLMLALLAYVRWTRRPSRAGYLAVAAALAAGLMSKPTVVTAPFLLLLLDAWPLRRLTRTGDLLPRVVEKLPFFALAAAACFATLAAQQGGGAVVPLDAMPLGLRAANAARSYVAYLVQTFRPTGLAAYYPLDPSPPAGSIISAVATLVLVTWLAVRERSRRPYLLVGWLWFLGALVPMIGLVQVGGHATADRYAYVPIVGLFVAVAWGAADLAAGRARVALAAGAVVAVGACAVLSRRQVETWRDSLVLWRHALDVTDGNEVAQTNLAVALQRRGRMDEAVAEFAEAVRMAPTLPSARMNLGYALLLADRVDDAVLVLREAVRLAPGWAAAHENLGFALLRQGRVDEALAELTEAVRLDPRSPQARNDLGAALRQAGRVEEARAQYEEALRLDPTNADADLALEELRPK